MPWDWPVEVTVEEANAFLLWLSATSLSTAPQPSRTSFRLPSLAEHRTFWGSGDVNISESSRYLPLFHCQWHKPIY